MFIFSFASFPLYIQLMLLMRTKLFYIVYTMLKKNMHSFEGFLDHLGLQLVQRGSFSFVWGVIDKLTTYGRRRWDLWLSFHARSDQLLEWYAESLETTTLLVFLFWVIGKLQVSTVWENEQAQKSTVTLAAVQECRFLTGPILAEFTWSDTRRLLPLPQDEEFTRKNYSYSAKMRLSIWAAVHSSQSVT